jgi:hypothetical protein
VVDGAHTTHMATSLKDLEQLKVSAVALGGNYVSIDLGVGASFDGVSAYDLPTFTDGFAQLSLDDIDQLINNDFNGASLSADISALAQIGIDQISLDNLDFASLEGFLTNSGSESLIKFDDLTAAINAHNAGTDIHTSLTLSINDSAVNGLVTNGFSFESSDPAAVTSHATHLSSSLQDLSALNVNQVFSTGGLINSVGLSHISLDLGELDLNRSMIESLTAALPVFTLDSIEAARGANALDVTLELTLNQRDDWSDFIGIDSTLSNDLIDALYAAGITGIETDVHLGALLRDSGDWIKLGLTDALQDAGIDYEQSIIGSAGTAAADNFDSALAQQIGALSDTLADPYELAAHNALVGSDLLSKFTDPEMFGELLMALSESGVSDFVVESGNVQISDVLAAALVEAGMLQAVPEANMVIDATARITQFNDETYGYLATNLKAIADLGVNAIETGNISSLYIDLGLPVNDAHAMADISQLLHSLDPANVATQLARNQNGDQVDISLVISGSIASTIKGAGGFSAADLKHLENLGINEITVLNAADDITDTNMMNSEVVAQGVLPLPDVKLIGVLDPMYDQLHKP